MHDINPTIIVSQYLQNAIKAIDAVLGPEYARKNPDLVAAFVRACAATACVHVHGYEK